MASKKIIVVLGLMAMPVASNAQTAVDDVRCLLVSNTYARAAKDPRARQVASAATMFYLGRIDGRVPLSSLRTDMAAQQKLLKPADGQAVMQNCAVRMEQAGKAAQSATPQSGPRPTPGK